MAKGVSGTGYWSNTGWVEGGNSANDPSYKNLTDRGETFGVPASSSNSSNNVDKNSPLTFDTPAYQQLTGQTSPTLTSSQKTGAENTIQDYKNYTAGNTSASSSSVFNTDGISQMIQSYKNQINKLTKNLSDTSNYYWNKDKATGEALTEAEKKMKAKNKSKDTLGLEDYPAESDGLTTIDSMQKDYYNNVIGTLNKNYNTVLDGLKRYGSTLDEQNQAMLDVIGTTFDQRRQQQIQENQQTIGGLGVAGLRSGRSRYASEMQDMLISEQERANLTKLSELDADERKAILEANTAYNDNKFKLFTQQMQTIQDLQKEKTTVVQNLFSNTLNYDQQLLARKQEARQEISSAIENTTAMAKLYAPMILRDLNGNSAHDEMIINQTAQRLGIDPETMRATVETFLYEAEQKAKDKGSKTDYVTADEAITRGLPPSLIGYTEQQYANDLYNPNPPKWFIDISTQESGEKQTAESVYDSWQAAREDLKSVESKTGATTDFSSVKPKKEEVKTETKEESGSWLDWFRSFGGGDEKESSGSLKSNISM